MERMTPQTRKILTALYEVAPDGELYGLEIADETGIKSGVLYPALRKLRNAGIVQAEWAESQDGRPPRRYYKLTPDGVALAHAAVTEPNTPAWKKFLPAPTTPGTPS